MIDIITPELLNILFSALAILIGLVVAIGLPVVMKAIRDNELVKKYDGVLDIAGHILQSAITNLFYSDVDMTEWEQREEQRENAGLPYIDARMLYILDRVQNSMARDGINLDFETLHDLAEEIYQALKLELADDDE